MVSSSSSVMVPLLSESYWLNKSPKASRSTLSKVAIEERGRVSGREEGRNGRREGGKEGGFLGHERVKVMERMRERWRERERKGGISISDERDLRYSQGYGKSSNKEGKRGQDRKDKKMIGVGWGGVERKGEYRIGDDKRQ
jgi:hypothetical protein